MLFDWRTASVAGEAIRAEAAARFDAATERHLTLAEREQATAERQLAQLDGDDGWSRLTDQEQQQAATRHAILSQDAATLPVDRLVKQARSTIAAGDKAAAYLLARGIRQRIDVGDLREVGDLAGVLSSLEATVGVADRAASRRALERRIEATKTLTGRVEAARWQVDGTFARVPLGTRW